MIFSVTVFGMCWSLPHASSQACSSTFKSFPNFRVSFTIHAMEVVSTSTVAPGNASRVVVTFSDLKNCTDIIDLKGVRVRPRNGSCKACSRYVPSLVHLRSLQKAPMILQLHPPLDPKTWVSMPHSLKIK